MLGVFLLLLLLVASNNPSSSTTVCQATSPTWTSDDRLAAAYYFYWYDIYSNLHFIDPDGSDALTDHPPEEYLANFSYKKVEWHHRELLDMMAAGIDIILPVYWGSEQELYWSRLGLQKLIQAEQAMIQEGLNPPKIGMFYDTTALMQQNGDVKPDLTTAVGKQLFYQMIADFFHEVPVDVWALIDDMPIVWLYTVGWVSFILPGMVIELPLQSSDPDGTTPILTIASGPTFASLLNKAGITYLRLAPTSKDLQPCPWRIRLLAQDRFDANLADAATLRVDLNAQAVFLPVVFASPK